MISMPRTRIRRAVKTAAVVAVICTTLAIIWLVFFSLKPYEVSAAQVREAYDYSKRGTPALRISEMTDRSWSFTYRSFDGVEVNGQIHYPQPPASTAVVFPVMIGVHGMGRSEVRWWQDTFKDRPTVEQTHRLSQLALKNGHAVIAIDARNHGQRKDPTKPLQRVMNDLHYFGKRNDYEDMVRETVLDHRVLLDWIVSNPTLDSSRISVAGYSMGAQVALLLAGVDRRISGVLAIAPPHIDGGTAIVAPLNVADGLVDTKIWLLSATDDEYASSRQNQTLFDSIRGDHKRHIVYAGGHILPEPYVDDLVEWFQ